MVKRTCSFLGELFHEKARLLSSYQANLEQTLNLNFLCLLSEYSFLPARFPALQTNQAPLFQAKAGLNNFSPSPFSQKPNGATKNVVAWVLGIPLTALPDLRWHAADQIHGIIGVAVLQHAGILIISCFFSVVAAFFCAQSLEICF